MKNFIGKNITIFAFVAIGILVSNIITYTYAHGGNLNLIHGCVRPISGLLRIVGANYNCGPNETALDWNIQGVQGPPGPSGSGDFICINCKDKDILHRINQANLTNYDFNNANLSFSFLNNKDISGSTFVYVVGAGLSMSQANGTNTDFTNANLRGANIQEGADFSNAKFVNADMAYGSYNGSTFINADFTNADLTNAFLNGSDVTGANFTGVIWSNTYCPDETNSNDNGGTCVGHF